MDKATKYIELLQSLYPNLNVRWEIPPHKIFENNECIIRFSSKTNPEMVLDVPYPDGIDEYSAEHNVEVLVAVYRSQLEELVSL
ncbi:hypothetical protein [Geobacter sp.]|uniref:hypothetical protein n=1 Tax=Geobacter sp. TaxID=46610 RepID=UPI00261113FA|nr:hypothetical protein [Geobacter sp.]